MTDPTTREEKRGKSSLAGPKSNLLFLCLLSFPVAAAAIQTEGEGGGERFTTPKRGSVVPYRSSMISHKNGGDKERDLQ